MSRSVSASDIDLAEELLATVVRRTPVEQSDRLTSLTGRRVLLKREDLQRRRSYKVRGAYYAIASLTGHERARGVVCASAGNHAQGTAFACSTLGIRGGSILPSNTPRQKRQRIEEIGGTLGRAGHRRAHLRRRQRRAVEDAAASGAVVVHPFDDPRTIAGQGTVAIEVAEQLGGEIGTVVVPVGGGGLISGMALWLREHHPAIRIIGAEPAGAPSMRPRSIVASPTTLDVIDTFVDGAAVKRVGDLTFPIVRDLVDEHRRGSRGSGLLRDARALPDRRDHRRARRCAGERRAAAHGSGGRRRRSSASSPAGTTTSAATPRSSSDRCSTRASGTTSSSTSPRSPARCGDSSTTSSPRARTSSLFEYVKKNNRETGPALVGIEIERASDLPELLVRLEASPLLVEPVSGGSVHFGFLF